MPLDTLRPCVLDQEREMLNVFGIVVLSVRCLRVASQSDCVEG